jgi:hypothetical protein
MQKETLAKGEKNECPRMNLTGSFLHLNIAANINKKIPIKNTTLKF